MSSLLDCGNLCFMDTPTPPALIETLEHTCSFCPVPSEDLEMT